VTSEGIRVHLALTHQTLADLVASRRPSVTTALAQLERERALVSTDRGWLLTGEPPDELYEFQELGPVPDRSADARS
jgi:CRP/FNR family transcriptional regulator, cyclic AMP receptor protein